MRRMLVLPLLLFAPLSSEAQIDKKADASAILEKARTVLAQLDGKITVPGIKSTVEVLRDRWGIPHIYAKDADDLFFAQGFVAAQDRLFQLDLWRRVAVGETAELFGEKSLIRDRFARLVRYRGGMQAEWQSYSPDTQRIAIAFTRGINAYIDHIAPHPLPLSPGGRGEGVRGDRLPIEFQILGTRPKKWQPEDILSRMSGISLTRNFRHEIARAQLSAAVGVDKANMLMPTDPHVLFAPAPGFSLDGITADVLTGVLAALKAPTFETPTESNNWVVSGTRSASGKPMLASDPHRPIAVPSLRYLVHLNAPGWNVIGSGEPALPGVAIGHNERIAWGFTIVGTDQCDTFVEEINPANRDEYKFEGVWHKVRTIWESVPVKGAKPVEIELRYTHRGPIVHEDAKTGRAFVFRWTGSEPGTAPYLGSLALGRSGNWDEFQAALHAWKMPTENIIYADVDGNIGWVATALTPVRKGHNGLLPVPGQTAKYDWQGFLSVKDLPQAFNPPSGVIATANHNILPPGYKHLIGYDWDAGYRFTQVKSRLDARKKFTLDDFKSIQHENTSLPARTLVRLLKNIEVDKSLAVYAEQFCNWDGVLSRQAQSGPLHAVWLDEIEQAMYGRHVPKKLVPVVRSSGSLKNLLTTLENPTQAWFGVSPAAERDALLQTTFAKAVARCRKLLGDEPANWSWGKLHTVMFHHPLEKLGAGYAGAFNLGPLGRPGDAMTPNNTRHNEKFEQIHGASYRHLFDLADWDRGLATSTPGQSGQPGSPHYADLLPLWAQEEYFPLTFSRKKVEEVTQHRLVLTPG